jgi:hypothetical protein
MTTKSEAGTHYDGELATRNSYTVDYRLAGTAVTTFFAACNSADDTAELVRRWNSWPLMLAALDAASEWLHDYADDNDDELRKLTAQMRAALAAAREGK